MQTKPRTKYQAIQHPVPATPPNEAGWSFAALLSVFTASLLIWMRRLGVHPADVEDATQEALVEAWQRASTLPTTHDETRREMLRIAAKIAFQFVLHAKCIDLQSQLTMSSRSGI